jgi:basic membrane protein A and related proteins
MIMKTSVLAALTVLMMGGSALSQELKPAIVFDMGGKFDKSFNEAAHAGIERFKKETNVDYRDFEITGDAQREQAIQRFATTP